MVAVGADGKPTRRSKSCRRLHGYALVDLGLLWPKGAALGPPNQCRTKGDGLLNPDIKQLNLRA